MYRNKKYMKKVTVLFIGVISIKMNIGLDLGLFNDKFTASLEYYNNTSNDLLLGRPTPTSLGFNTGNVTENVESVETKGFEVNLGYND